MSIIVFKCKKCGTCCRNLFRDKQGIREGLLLTEQETQLFRSEMISPRLGIGMKEPQEIIILYQLNVNNCPHINQKSECEIYDKRPLMCRAFPYDNVSREPSVECTAINSPYVDVYLSSLYKAFEKEIEASNKMERYLRKRFNNNFQKGIKVWVYDLKTKKWIMKAQHNKLPPYFGFF